MNDSVNLKNIFDDVVTKAKDYQAEMFRLYNIEERAIKKLDELKDRVVGLEKSLDYSGISYQAKEIIREQLYKTKNEANFYCYLLGMSSLYKDEKR